MLNLVNFEVGLQLRATSKETSGNKKIARGQQDLNLVELMQFFVAQGNRLYQIGWNIGGSLFGNTKLLG